jgi:mannonate dehydratase
MHLGFGFYRHMLTEPYYRFAAQCGATHAVVHMCDYGKRGQDQGKDNQPVGDDSGWGLANHPGLWTEVELRRIKDELAAWGLKFYAIENFDPMMWSDILLNGPGKHEQMAQLKEQIRMVGSVGIPVFGYNFSLAGVAARDVLTTRGGAATVGLTPGNTMIDKPLPLGMVWNMVVDPNAPAGIQPTVPSEEFWERFAWFLRELVPTAEKAGVILAAHPDDPPMKQVRRQPRLVYRHDLYQRLLDLVPSPSNALEFCVGTLAEMPEGDLYACVEHYARQNKPAYVHLRNVRGHVPNYVETFIDEGDIDVGRVLGILAAHGFEGVIVPDHTPQMTCDAPWHAGMAFAMGYLKAKIDALVEGSK